ncbi:unnamed protein product [Bursaphelenchus xylophilus]|uniref:(pine wood nematode) hypothetical protein n=1 Tax=Bursaphelenchus xylophilus TaxID=6326 RepID=A0A1I7SX51_BURXY|nr:unnamed protein product [Bursaphelenchus xylophilus]CAG9100176.1 unnamed protein product [Bursaphelenchus xylophilus]
METNELLLFMILSLLTGKVTAIATNDLKPCFERYDGFKIVDSAPFHSEWRMKSEDQCLEFCVRSSSRCVSIVYDKYSHICHYFSINAIEAELIVKSPRMVYFQTAEKECIDRKLLQIITEENARQTAMMEIQKIRASASSTSAPLTSPTTIQPESPSTATFKEDLEANDESILALDADFDGDPMNFVKLVDDEKEEESGYTSTRSPSSVITTTESTTASTTTTAPTQTTTAATTISAAKRRFVEPSTSTSTTSTSTTTTPTTTTPSTTTSVLTSQSVTPVITKPTTTAAPATQKIVPQKVPAPVSELPPSFPVIPSMDDKIDEMMPIMSGFKIQKKTLPDMIEEAMEKKPEIMEVRRSPGKSRGPIAKTFDEEEEETPRPSIYDANCKEGAHEIWLAVENSQVDSGIRSSVLKLAALPQECMDTCKTLEVGGYNCDSFTFLESSKRCIFHASPHKFSVKPAFSNDFSTRAFKKYCFPGDLTPFNDCVEFLAFRDYSMEMEPREVFEGLPSTNEGISACIELCVLATEFRCKSANFDQQSGMCLLFAEHSLSRPAAFREHQLANQIYFENGCVPVEVPTEQEVISKYAKTERITPVKLDYRKITH